MKFLFRKLKGILNIDGKDGRIMYLVKNLKIYGDNYKKKLQIK